MHWVRITVCTAVTVKFNAPPAKSQSIVELPEFKLGVSIEPSSLITWCMLGLGSLKFLLRATCQRVAWPSLAWFGGVPATLIITSGPKVRPCRVLQQAQYH